MLYMYMTYIYICIFTYDTYDIHMAHIRHKYVCIYTYDTYDIHMAHIIHKYMYIYTYDIYIYDIFLLYTTHTHIAPRCTPGTSLQRKGRLTGRDFSRKPSMC